MQMLRKLLTIFGVVTLSLWTNASVYAAAIINVDQVGSDVVATITGSINSEGLDFTYAYIYDQNGIISGADNYDGLLGVGESTTVGLYNTVSEHHDISTSPLYFHADTNTGGHFQIREVNYSDQGVLMLPYDYVSNTSINSTSTWSGYTIGDMGLIPGTYLYNLANGDTITLNIGEGPSPDPTYSVGGTVSGLTGSVTLQNNGGDDIINTTNDAFTFATELEVGFSYAVTVSTQPTGQTCVVSNESGTISDANVTDVAVTCTDNPELLYTINGSASGLGPNSVTLQNNLTDDLVVSANGVFVFATALADGSTYDVTVLTQPTGQTCDVTNGNGTISSTNVLGVDVDCVDDVIAPPPVPMVPVPTLSQWALILLTMLLGLMVFANRRRLF
jgi:hypothetical protein